MDGSMDGWKGACMCFLLAFSAMSSALLYDSLCVVADVAAVMFRHACMHA